MASSDQPITTYFICGSHTLETTKLNAQSSIDQIHEEVRSLYGTYLPSSYWLMFYNIQTKQFIKLNHYQLESPFSPFRLNTLNNNVNMLVNLYVIESSHRTAERITPSGISFWETSSDENIVDILTLESYHVSHEEGLPASNNTANADGTELLDGLRNNELVDSDISRIIENDPEFQASVSQSFNAQISASSLPESNEPSEQIAMGNADPPQTIIPNPTQSRLSAEENSTQDIGSHRLHFALDVKPKQKDIYKSDKFNQTEKTKENGHLTRIQGIKTPAQKCLSVWPRLHIPRVFRNRPYLSLVVYVVSEKSQDGIRIWSKHRDKGFLPKDYTNQTPPINPIIFKLDENPLTTEGDMRLELLMTTMWQKLQETKEVHKLDEQSTINLHPAPHESPAPRLLCFLADDSQQYMETFCLSDFIRLKRYPARSSTEQSNAPAKKRKK